MSAESTDRSTGPAADQNRSQERPCHCDRYAYDIELQLGKP
jgi:hypothetical protein